MLRAAIAVTALVAVALLAGHTAFAEKVRLPVAVNLSAVAWYLRMAGDLRRHAPASRPAVGPLRAAGQYSYGIYVVHPFVFELVRRFWAGDGIFLRGLVVAVASVILAWLSYHGFEKHFLRLKGRLASGPARQRPWCGDDRWPEHPPAGASTPPGVVRDAVTARRATV